MTAPRRRICALIVVSLCLISGLAHAGIRIASWNCKHLGWHNQKDFPAMAQVISRFDLVALQEVMHPAAAQHLAALAQQRTGEPWGVATSHTEGHGGYREGYAFLWRKSAVAFEGGATLYVDGSNRFLRPPFSAQFKAREPADSPAFIAATVHIKYGDSKRDRAPEIEALAGYWRWLGQHFSGEPRLLMGDFNTPPTSPAWAQLRRWAKPLITHGASTLSRQPGRYAHLYDDIWTGGGLPIAQEGIGHYPEWLGISHKRAYSVVSDHAPVFIGIGNARVDTRAFSNATRRLSASTIKTAYPASTNAPANTAVTCINLNTATATQLDRLDHVGKSRAQAIIDGRPWASLEGLTRVRGLSVGRVADIRGQHLTCMH